MAMGEGAVWVIGDANDRTLWRIDPRLHRIVSTIRLGFPPAKLAVGEGAVWVTDGLDDRLVAGRSGRRTGSCGAFRSAAAPAVSPSARAASG